MKYGNDDSQDAALREVQVSGEQVFRGRLLDVRVDCVRLPDGQESGREYIVHQGAAVIIPILDNGDLLFERQFRYPIGSVFLELPAGKIDPGEDALSAARRELLEETGYVAEDWRHVGRVHPCVGYSSERIEIYAARRLQQAAAQSLDHEEFLEVFSMSLDAALEAIKDGRITDAKTVSCLFWAEKILRHGW